MLTMTRAVCLTISRHPFVVHSAEVAELSARTTRKLVLRRVHKRILRLARRDIHIRKLTRKVDLQ